MSQQTVFLLLFYYLPPPSFFLAITVEGTQKLSMHHLWKAGWKELCRYGRVKACPVLLAIHYYHFEKPLGLQEECENAAAFPANIWFPLLWIISLLPPFPNPHPFLLFPHFILKVHQTLFFPFNIFLKLPSLNLLGSVTFLVIHYWEGEGSGSLDEIIKKKPKRTRREKHLSSVGKKLTHRGSSYA